MDTTMLLTVILILSVALLFATLPRLYRPRRTITKARPETLEWKVGPDQKDLSASQQPSFLRNYRRFSSMKRGTSTA